jgi:hypothetical protein
MNGTATISNITVPLGFSTGFFLIVPTQAWQTNTAGNIGNAFTAVPGTPVVVVFDGTKFWFK